MKQGQCIFPLSWSVHCNFTGEGKCNERGWACTPHPHQPGLILPSSLNVRQKAAVATLCTLWWILYGPNCNKSVNVCTFFHRPSWFLPSHPRQMFCLWTLLHGIRIRIEDQEFFFVVAIWSVPPPPTADKYRQIPQWLEIPWQRKRGRHYVCVSWRARKKSLYQRLQKKRGSLSLFLCP
jgi:hypothetical protein